jgi:hypothetical protein
MGFLRGLLTPRHLQAAGLDAAAFWADAQARCDAASPGRLQGRHDWALLHFVRKPITAAEQRRARSPVQPIACSARS